MDYRFKLEALRKYRVFQEEARQKELAEALRWRDQQAEILADLIHLRSKTEQNLKVKQNGGGITGPYLTIFSNYLNKLASDIFAQNHNVAEAEKKLDNTREALLVAMQKRKTLDKLKENGLKAHMRRLSSEEEKFINEMAISRFTFRQK
jgi:flagellar export protein FliJ